MDRWYLENLACPRDFLSLELGNGMLTCPSGHQYPVIDGVPVMLRDDVPQTMQVAEASLNAVSPRTEPDQAASHLYLESLGVNDHERASIAAMWGDRLVDIDPVVSYLIAATNGIMYKELVGRLKAYPIPELRLPESSGAVFLDLGCSWGRWCVAAARKGYSAVGIDPSLGAIMAARRVAKQLGLPINYVVADARYLPLRESRADVVFSYSVLQHFSKENVAVVLAEAARTLKPNGTSLVQMPTMLGIRCLYQQAKRGFRKPRGFEVRYWGIPELKRTFAQILGKSSISADCYFGIGIQKSDIALMPLSLKIVTVFSEALRALSKLFPFFLYAADSVYIESIVREKV